MKYILFPIVYYLCSIILLTILTVVCIVAVFIFFVWEFYIPDKEDREFYFSNFRILRPKCCTYVFKEAKAINEISLEQLIDL